MVSINIRYSNKSLVNEKSTIIFFASFIFQRSHVGSVKAKIVGRVRVTKRAESIEYAIRDVIGYTDQLVSEGRKIFYLNIGDPPSFDFHTPTHVTQALCKAVQENNNHYSPSEGLPELREAIIRKEKRVNDVEISPCDVLVTEGVSEGIEMILATLVEKGDEILFPGPTYPPYIS